MKHVFLVVLVAGFLTGCGFHLRGTQGPLLSFSEIHVEGARSPMGVQVLERLAFSQVTVSDAASAPLSLTLFPEVAERRGVSTSGSVSVAEYELTLALEISVFSREGEVLLDRDTLTIARIYQLDDENPTAILEEEEVLLEEMRSRLADRVLRRVSAAARPSPGPEAPVEVPEEVLSEPVTPEPATRPGVVPFPP